MALELTPLAPTFGVVIGGIDLRERQPELTVSTLRQLLREHRLLLFRQGADRLVSGERHVEISQWFGPLESTFHRHPRSPHVDVFRVSNDPEEGCTQVGRSGWHIDGSFQERPFKVQLMHFPSVIEGGDTLFAPLTEVIEALPNDTRAEWESLTFVARAGVAHPLIYPHPETGARVLCFHCGEPFVHTFAVGFEPASGRARSVQDRAATRETLREISQRLESHAYRMEWAVGDFAIVDNLALAHYAVPGTQRARGEAGLRLLHRTTVAGDSSPAWGQHGSVRRT